MTGILNSDVGSFSSVHQQRSILRAAVRFQFVGEDREDPVEFGVALLAIGFGTHLSPEEPKGELRLKHLQQLRDWLPSGWGQRATGQSANQSTLRVCVSVLPVWLPN